MKERYKTYGYEITTDPSFQNKRYGVTPELEKLLGMLAVECHTRKDQKLIDKLTRLIIQYPDIPMLKNYLSVAYNMQGNIKKAREVNQWILTEHPDYLFAKLNYAHTCIEEKEFDNVPEILGEAMEIKQLYPQREVFHLAEVMAYLSLAVRYFAAIKNLELAENRLNLMKEIDPFNKDTQNAESYLRFLRLEKSLDRYEKESELRITPKKVSPEMDTTQKDAPVFNHPEIENLYLYGLRIPHELLSDILALPRTTLIADLEMVVKDSIRRFDYFTELEYSEETHSFLIHALFLLKELNAENSLLVLLSALSMDDEYMEIMLGEFLTYSVWQCLYQLGINQLEVLNAFLQTPGIYTYSKTTVFEALGQIALHHPERREEIVTIIRDLFIQFSDASIDDNLIDSEFLGLAISETIDSQLTELLPVIKILFDKGYVDLGISGDYNDVVKEFSEPPVFNRRKELLSIFEYYNEVLETWASYNEDNDLPQTFNNDTHGLSPSFNPDKYDITESNYLSPQPIKAEKIERNGPCPCGSGKKYKKCCGS